MGDGSEVHSLLSDRASAVGGDVSLEDQALLIVLNLQGGGVVLLQLLQGVQSQVGLEDDCGTSDNDLSHDDLLFRV